MLKFQIREDAGPNVDRVLKWKFNGFQIFNFSNDEKRYCINNEIYKSFGIICNYIEQKSDWFWIENVVSL